MMEEVELQPRAEEEQQPQVEGEAQAQVEEEPRRQTEESLESFKPLLPAKYGNLRSLLTLWYFQRVCSQEKSMAAPSVGGSRLASAR